MKAVLLFLRAISVVLLTSLLACDKSDYASPVEFSYHHAAGVWVIYEFESDGVKSRNDNMNSLSIFGAYNASVTLKDDQSYIPLNLMHEGHYVEDSVEAGEYAYNADDKTIVFTASSMVLTYTVEEYTSTKMELRNGTMVYRFKKGVD